jgi:hypothetical protein
MTRMNVTLAVAGILAWAAGVEAGYVERYIYLQKQGSVCRGTVVNKDIWVSNSDDGVIWRIENQGCDEPAYVQFKSDIASMTELPPSCQRTYKVPDDVNLPPLCQFLHQTSAGGTYGYNVYVNCQPGPQCPAADPEIVVERDGGLTGLLNVRVSPPAHILRVPVTLTSKNGSCQAQVESAAVGKRIRSIEWTFENKCGEAHHVDLRRVPSIPTARPMVSRECNQTVTVGGSPMFVRCPLEDPLDTARTYEYSVAVDCIGKAPCTPTKATLTRAQ